MVGCQPNVNHVIISSNYLAKKNMTKRGVSHNPKRPIGPFLTLLDLEMYVERGKYDKMCCMDMHTKAYAKPRVK